MKNAVKPWIDLVASGRPYVFQQDSAPAHKSRETQAWLLENLPYHGSPDLWPPVPLTATPRLFLLGRGREQDQQAHSQHSRLPQGCHRGGVRQYEEGRRRQGLRPLQAPPRDGRRR
ncbi:Uncharacterized protein FKW44_015148 [Caligus rogercresseyi]|uniref:Tc1-like transposase DDE domain-containing protein n=1 Tax=Caligus rogercresseyi TaxID=217165 RepID=A0A7T8GZV8_CALRO|nr:Uncharacterized protein FKW44_015148 [Caligus rogercresseyi]